MHSRSIASLMEHRFFRLIAEGSISKHVWLNFLRQQTVYLPMFSAACCLLAAREAQHESRHQLLLRTARSSLADSNDAGRALKGEIGGALPEIGSATTAYGGYLVRVVQTESVAAAMAALSACVLIYPHVAHLLKGGASAHSSFVKAWTELAASREAMELAASWRLAMNEIAVDKSVIGAFAASVTHEIRFLEEVSVRQLASLEDCLC
jgi:thiaminase